MMDMQWSSAVSAPTLLARLSSDEYRAPAYCRRDRQALEIYHQYAATASARLQLTLAQYRASRLGTAASLFAINAASNTPFYRISASSSTDIDEANEIFRGQHLVIDVQTHYVAAHRTALSGATGVHHFIRQVAPEIFSGLNLDTDLSLAEYLRCVFLQSETCLAVLTSAPGTEETNILSNSEIAATRELIDRLAGSGRLLHHSIVHPNLPGELEHMSAIVERCRPNGFKVYTLYGGGPSGPASPRGWMLDDEECGEGPFVDGIVQRGTDRLIQGLRDAGIGPGGNVYAELGSTWYILIKRPEEAVHVMGKLLLALGEDNILWGTDSVWYGNTQPLIDAFRAFQIPEEYQERYGYPALTDSAKAKILGRNAARVYGVDEEKTLARARNDSLAWIRDAIAELQPCV